MNWIRIYLLKSLYTLRSDIALFFYDLTIYLQKRLGGFGKLFEDYKRFLVELLMAKRGRYQESFLNTSLFTLVVSGVIAAPYISSQYPTLAGEGEVLSSVAPLSATVTDLNFDQMSMATQESVKPRDQVIDYVVQSGDTVSSIAQKFDISEDTVRWVNNLKGANPVVKPGEILKIPPVSGVVHKVQRGETIYSIAKKYQTEPQNIVNFPFNDFVDLENFTLSVSQTLIVPDGVIEEPDLPARTSPLRPKAPEYLAKTSLGQLLFPTTGSITQQPVWYHMALDIANRAAPDVYAAEAGTVSLATCYQWGYGCHIIVDHGNGMQTLYAHLSSFYVSAGQSVGRGDALGRMGSTGRSTGTHLHFEVRNGGVAINPWNYLQ